MFGVILSGAIILPNIRLVWPFHLRPGALLQKQGAFDNLHQHFSKFPEDQFSQGVPSHIALNPKLQCPSHTEKASKAVQAQILGRTS